MQHQELLGIRKQILDSALPLILESRATPEERFDLTLRFMQLSGGDWAVELYRKAYEMAVSFDSSEDKLDALLRLLGEIDMTIDSQSEDDPDSSPLPEASDAASRDTSY